MTRFIATLLFAAAIHAQTPTPGTGRVVITFNPNAANPAGVTRNIYRAAGPCNTATNFAKVNAAPVAVSTYTDVIPIGIFCYYSTTLFAGLESIPSNQITGTVSPLPETITISLQVAINITKDGVIVSAKLVDVAVPGATTQPTVIGK